MERRRMFGHLYVQNEHPETTMTNETSSTTGEQDKVKHVQEELQSVDDIVSAAATTEDLTVDVQKNMEAIGSTKRRSCLPSHAAVAEDLREQEFMELLESAFAEIDIEVDESSAVVAVEPMTIDHEKGSTDNGGVAEDDMEEIVENVTTLPPTAFCRSPQRFCLKDMHRPASYDKSIKKLLKAKKHRTEKLTHAKSLEMRNYDTWEVSSGGKHTRQKVTTFDKSNVHISTNESWLANRSISGNSSSNSTHTNGIPHPRLNTSSSLDGIDISPTSQRSRSPSHTSNNNKSTLSTSPLPPPPPFQMFRTAIDMLLFPSNVAFGNDGSTVTTSRERQVIMARMMSTPEKIPKKHENTHRNAKFERDKLTNERKEELEKIKKERIRLQAKATAERAKRNQREGGSSTTPTPSKQSMTTKTIRKSIVEQQQPPPPPQQPQHEGDKSSESSSFLRALRKSFVHTNIDPELVGALL